jgi:hypothetical protein
MPSHALTPAIEYLAAFAIEIDHDADAYDAVRLALSLLEYARKVAK